MLTQSLAMIGGQDHQHRSPRAALPCRLQQFAEPIIGIGYLPVIGAVFAGLPEFARWFVGVVRVIEMHPGERGHCIHACPPGHRSLHGILGTPLDPALLAVIHLIVVMIESAIQSEHRL